MPPKALRQTTQRQAVALPLNARFTFLAEASSAACALGCEALARHIGALALLVSNQALMNWGGGEGLLPCGGCMGCSSGV
jgi:hypothetical protein